MWNMSSLILSKFRDFAFMKGVSLANSLDGLSCYGEGEVYEYEFDTKEMAKIDFMIR